MANKRITKKRAKAKPKKSQNQLEFEKQIRRIKRIAREQQKKGITIFLDEIELLEQPKRVSAKRLSELKKLTPKKLQAEYGGYVDMETGEVKRGLKPSPPKRKPRKTAYNKAVAKAMKSPEKIKLPPLPVFTDSALAQVKKTINMIQKNSVKYMLGDSFKRELLGIVEENLSQYGEAYEEYLVDNLEEIIETIMKVVSSKYLDNSDSRLSDCIFVLKYDKKYAESSVIDEIDLLDARESEYNLRYTNSL